MSTIRPAKECQDFRSELSRDGLLEAITRLYRPRDGILLMNLSLIGALVAGATAVVLYVSWWFIPVSIIVVASQQRALKNFVHDASHRNLSRSARWNDLLARYLLAPLTFEDFDVYREKHMLHHAHLGSAKDPDFMPPDDRGTNGSAWRLYLKMLLSWSMWKFSVGESLPRLNGKQRLYIVGWWATFSAVLGVLTSAAAVGCFLGLWMLSKATTYHCVQAFCELCDHARLPTTSIIAYTRNMPKNALSWLLHPFNDNYHLVHHLIPKVPMVNLSKAHRILLNNARYAGGPQCDSYFFGPRSVVKTWFPSVQAARELPAPASRKPAPAVLRPSRQHAQTSPERWPL
ncbi:fatty acid desaturase family protein [Sorangium sp. So ce406]|uniref:fatty acid desaturase family protein n=1 Tax=Sorangium sp. So ce406 TaxID=3133311 RepID=UPI003F5BC528